MAGATAACFFGAYCPDSFTDEMIAGGVVPVVAGQFAPNGTAVPNGDMYRLTGKYSFGSGVAHADWVGGGAFTAPPEGEQAEFRLMMMPRSEVELLGNWDVLGLRATSSYDYSIDADVPAHATFEFFSPTRYRGGPMYDLGVIILTEIRCMLRSPASTNWRLSRRDHPHRDPLHGLDHRGRPESHRRGSGHRQGPGPHGRAVGHRR